MMKIDEYVIPQDKEGQKNYNNESPFGKMLYKIILWNSNFPMFMCGIISAIPITLLMNLIVTNVFEVSGKHWLAYTVIYIVTFLASVLFCVMAFWFTVMDLEIEEGTDSEFIEEKYNMIFYNFYSRIKSLKRCVILLLIGGIITMLGMFALIIIVNMPQSEEQISAAICVFCEKVKIM